MLLNILNIVTPVFLVISMGWLSVRQKLFDDNMINALMKFAIQFAVPCLLFRATASLDLTEAYNWRLIFSFYIGATVSFILASLFARKFFKRNPGESIAIGFIALFSNTVLLGLPIAERAWGEESLSPAYAIISLHAPFCYLLGITSIESFRSDGRSFTGTAKVVIKSMFSNSLMIGIGLGFIVNFSGLALPQVAASAIDIVSNAALPVALFGLGGVLTRYKLSHSMTEATVISIFSLLVHPGITFLVSNLIGLSESLSRMAVLIAAMAPGINSYLFATMYKRGEEIAASTVLFATVISVFSVSTWLWILT